MCKLGGRDHNATSYSTETNCRARAQQNINERRDHNATSYSTETGHRAHKASESEKAEIITLRAIALKRDDHDKASRSLAYAEIITLRAIALKRISWRLFGSYFDRRDHNATSYSTETFILFPAWLITSSRDHNATSYSTETRLYLDFGLSRRGRQRS